MSCESCKGKRGVIEEMYEETSAGFKDYSNLTVWSIILTFIFGFIYGIYSIIVDLWTLISG